MADRTAFHHYSGEGGDGATDERSPMLRPSDGPDSEPCSEPQPATSRYAHSAGRTIRNPTPLLAGSTGISMETHPEDHPYKNKADGALLEKLYFPRLVNEGRPAGKEKTVVVCVPMYNEEAAVLQNTLGSLHNMTLDPVFVMDVIILMDGVQGSHLPSQSARSYLTRLFGVDWSGWSEAGSMGGSKEQTTIYESLRTFGSDPRGGAADDRNCMRLSLLIKKKNHRKHNSHEWFMKSFAKELDCTYVFCTDCATTFHKDMLNKLIRYLEKDPTLAGVCGRQRVMPVEVQTRGQRPPEYRHDESTHNNMIQEMYRAPCSWFLRCVQTYDFEADLKPAWDWLGFLPVLPGPCALYRYDQLKQRCDKYFEIVNKPANECGLWLANLKIAEDRIPSMLAVFPMNALQLSAQEHGFNCRPDDRPFKTHWVRDAVFYFEAETSLKMLVLQRRRWLNGTLAGNVYMAVNMRNIVFSSRHSWWVKLCTFLMVWMQLVQVVVLALGPGVFAAILFGTTHTIATHYSGTGQNHVSPAADVPPRDWLELVIHRFDEHAQLATVATAFYLISYLVFLHVHRCGAKSPFCPWAWKVVTMFNLLIIFLLMFVLTLSPRVFRDEFNDFESEIHTENLDAAARTPAPVVSAPTGATCPAACGLCPPRNVTGACCHGNKTCEVSNWSPESCTSMYGTWCNPTDNDTSKAPGATFGRCGFSQFEAQRSCGIHCSKDSDCDIIAGEICWKDVGVPEGCIVRFLGTFLLATYVLVVPFSFALFDAPVNGSLRVVELMLKSCIPYLLFMPTFVGYFLAYSLNRLADVSWGNRGSGEPPTKGGISMKRWANCIAILMPILNLLVATSMCVLRLYRPQYVQTIFLLVMIVAGHTYAIAFVATAVALLRKTLACICCKKNEVYFVMVEGQALVGDLDHTGERKVTAQLDQDDMFVRSRMSSWMQSISSATRSTFSSSTNDDRNIRSRVSSWMQSISYTAHSTLSSSNSNIATFSFDAPDVMYGLVDDFRV